MVADDDEEKLPTLLKMTKTKKNRQKLSSSTMVMGLSFTAEKQMELSTKASNLAQKS
jgi:hypothetical protein